MRDWQNIGIRDRGIRIAVGLALLVVGLVTQSVLVDTFLVVSAILLGTGLSGFCLVYRVLGITTRPRVRPGSYRRAS